MTYTPIKSLLAALAVPLALAMTVQPAVAAEGDYPNRPITVLVGFPPGGLTDVLARRFAQYLQTELNATVIVVNKPGASGQIASTQLVNSAPDGYNLLVAATHHVINPAINSKLPYDTVKDFVSIGELGSAPNVLLVNNDVPASNLQEFLAYSRSRPGGLAFGSTSLGGSTHFSGELLMLEAKVPMLHVPYKGAAPMMTDLLGGQVPSAFNDLQGAATFIKAKRVKAIGVTSKERSTAFPDVPTIAEQGMPGFEVTTFIGVYGPAGMPPAIVERINKWAVASANTPESLDFLQRNGGAPGKRNVAEFQKYVNDEIVKWQRVAKERNIKLDN